MLKEVEVEKPHKKRKRGRPKKKPVEIPKFKTDSEIRKFLIEEGIKLAVEIIAVAMKKNNIKNPTISRAKTQQYKTALESLKVLDSILKNKQLTEMEDKLQIMEEGITASLNVAESNNIEPSENVLKAVEDLTKLNTEFESLKGD